MFPLILGSRCSRKDLARKYFAQASNWIRQDADPQKKLSRDFDLKSIMIYDSMTGRVAGADGFPLVTTTGEVIHIGGDSDSEQAGISDLDIERVVELYPTGSEHSHSKRGELNLTPGESDSMLPNSHSTPGEPQEKQHAKRCWSVQEEYDANSIDSQPWPASDTGKHTITYCFETAAAWNALGAIWTRALAKWAVAVEASSLEFTPDTECDRLNQSPCSCRTPGIADETVHIMQAPPGQPFYSPRATLGYKNRNAPRTPGMPRHFLIWPANANFLPSQSHAGFIMAHELGEKNRPPIATGWSATTQSQPEASGWLVGP